MSSELSIRSKKVCYVIAALFFILGVFFTLRGYSCEYDYYNPCVILNSQQSRTYRDKKNYHQDQGIKAYERAHEKTWWLPRLADRTMGRSCFVTAMTMATANTPQSVLVCGIINLMTTYGLAALDEWDYINYNLAEAQHHFEMMEFYNDVLNKA